MAREQLLGLASDVDRLLAAGASSAGGNENLSKRGKSLRDLGQKVPALKPVADAVDKVLEAPGKQAGNSFLDLVAMTRQLRGSLCGVGVEGTLTPAQAGGSWTTSLYPRDLSSLYVSLTESGSGREDTLKDAIQRKATGDLRLLSPLLDALDDAHAPLGELVAREALPALGLAVIPEVEARLKIADGKAGDARRLDVIGRLNPGRALELCRQALKDGSIAMRVKALEMLPDVADKEEAERTGLEACKDKSAEVRVAALVALRDATGEEALNTVLAAAGDRSANVRNAVMATLAKIKNPDTTPRLLDLLQDALQQLDQLKPAKQGKETKKPTGKKAAAGKTSKKDTSFEKKELADEVVYWLGILGSRKGAGRMEAARAVLPLLSHKEATIRQAAMTALGGIGAVIDGVIECFIEGLKDKKPAIANLAARNLTPMEPELREPAMPTVLELLEKSKLDQTLRRSLLGLLPGHTDRQQGRIVAILRNLLAGKDHWLRNVVLETLTQIGSPGAELVPDVVKAAAATTTYYYYRPYSNCLLKIDPEGTLAVPALIEMIGSRKHYACYQAVSCLQAYGPKARAAVPAIRQLIEKEKKDGGSHWAEQALRAIETG